MTNPSTGHRTQVRVKTNAGGYALVDAIAGVKVEGYVFLIHRSLTQNELYSATYAPIGIGITNYDSIERVIAQLEENEHRVDHAIKRQLATMAEECIPLLGPETGIESDSWHYREQCRFDSGEYRALPSISGREYPKDHYVHLSVTKTESDFIAYTPNDAYGLNDRQVRMRFGKYLKKVFSDMPDAEVQAAVVSLRAQLALEDSPATLLFTTERDKISEIFETQMYACDSSYVSCMHDKFTEWEHRPYHVYAGSPDVAVAYVVERGEVIARSVVSTKYRSWIRAYSVKQYDSTLCGMLTGMLAKEGFRHGSLAGNRLTKLPRRNYISFLSLTIETGKPILPYIDHGGMGVKAAGKWWIVTEEDEGEYNCDQTDGTATESNRRDVCSRCENDEEECSCIYCDCCEESYPDGCNICSICEQCDRCMEHGTCQCVRCEECNDIVVPRNRHITACDCDRCGECQELESNCECERCSECNELTENCECETASDTTTVECAEVQA